MQIVQPRARLLGLDIDEGNQIPDLTPADGVKLIRKIEYHARKSHMSTGKMTADSWQRFIQFVVVEKGDWSVVEHAAVSVEMNDDRGIQQEITRHRIASYTIESTRFINYAKDENRPARYIYPRPQDEVQHPMWLAAVKYADTAYRALLADGWTPQEARSVFPLALDSNIDVTENLRSWRHFLLMRTTREAHPQMRNFAIPLLDRFKSCIPLLFDDIEPMQTQKHNVRLPR